MVKWSHVPIHRHADLVLANFVQDVARKLAVIVDELVALEQPNVQRGLQVALCSSDAAARHLLLPEELAPRADRSRTTTAQKLDSAQL